MKQSLLERLRCPSSGQRLSLTGAVQAGDEVESGALVSVDGRHHYPIVRSVPRFVPVQNYAESFGLQWNRFRRTQLDSQSGQPISRNRFYRFTGWSPDMLEGRWVLDAGCGAGRFTEVALEAGATVVALDYSSSVDACHANLGPHPRLHVVQGNIMALPFEPGKFDFVFSLGVLQHTPDPARAFNMLPSQLRPGGRLAVDLYPALLRNMLWPKYWLRPFTSRMAPERLFQLVERWTPALLPVSKAMSRLPMIGRYLRYALPVANYDGIYPLSDKQLEEWAVLDTFDMLAPVHDHPQSRATLERWLAGAGLEEREVERIGFLTARGRKPVEVAAHQ
jgi:SAM-dependent methyltransferase